MLLKTRRRLGLPIRNVYCPTGPGGGVDPTCSPGGAGVSAPSSAKALGQTNTLAFKKWFGKSKVVDEKGQPRVVYHGTMAEPFEQFKTSGQDHYVLSRNLGSHFAEDPTVTEAFTVGQYAQSTDYVVSDRPGGSWYRLPGGQVSYEGLPLITYKGKDGKETTELYDPKKHGGTWEVRHKMGEDVRLSVLPPGGKTFAVYLSIKNPLVVDPPGHSGDDYTISQEVARTIFPKDKALFIEAKTRSLRDGDAPVVRQAVGDLWDSLNAGKPTADYKSWDDLIRNEGGTILNGKEMSDRAREALLRLGYDGVKYRNTSGNEVKGKANPWAWIALKPEQIKSALGNRGTFDPKDPIITHARGPRRARGNRPNPLRADPSRTYSLRNRFARALTGRYRLLRAAILKLVEGEDAFGLAQPTHNVFCPTGEGGGIDPTCSPGSNSQTSTPRFKKWFGKSKVVDKAGNPKRLYHGTGAQVFSAFDVGKSGSSTDSGWLGKGIYLTDTPRVSDWYSLHGGTESRTYPVYVKMEKPLVLKSNPGLPKTQAIHFAEDKRIDRELAKANYPVDPEGLSKVIRAAGYDGVIYKMKSSTEYMVLDPEQIKSAIGNKGTFDPKDPIITHQLVGNQRWRFHTNAKKVEEFRRWLSKQAKYYILGDVSEPMKAADFDWLEQFAYEGYLKGAGRAFADTKRPMLDKDGATSEYYEGSREDFLRKAFGRQVSVQKIEELASRSYNDLQGVNDAMAAKMSRTLLDGLVQGKSHFEVARDLADNVDSIGINRARTIARTEIIRAHAEGQLDALEELGVAEVGVMVEWKTSDLGETDRGNPSPCPSCDFMGGTVFTIDEARGLLPRHPNCLCCFMPANVGEDTSGQIRGRKSLERAIQRSVRAETGEYTQAAMEDSTWAGADVEIEGERPKSLFNSSINNQRWTLVWNIYCATGPGGGIDPTCTAADTGGGASAPAEKVSKPDVPEGKYPSSRSRSALEAFHGEKLPIKGTGLGGRRKASDLAAYLNQRTIQEHGIIEVPAKEIQHGKPLPQESLRQLDELAKSAATEIETMYRKDPAPAEWYRNDVTQALEIVAQHKPEIRDPVNRSLFTALVAINSNGTAVDENFRHALDAYDQITKSDLTVEVSWGGATQATIQSSTNTLLALIKDQAGGSRQKGESQEAYQSRVRGAMEKLFDPSLRPNGTPKGFLHREIPETVFRRVMGGTSSGDTLYEYDENGQPHDTKVWGSWVFGPKIGSFFQNLNGNFKPVTMDRWLARSEKRLRGKLVTPISLKTVENQTARLAKAILDLEKEYGNKLQGLTRTIKHPKGENEDQVFLASTGKSTEPRYYVPSELRKAAEKALKDKEIDPDGVLAQFVRKRSLMGDSVNWSDDFVGSKKVKTPATELNAACKVLYLGMFGEDHQFNGSERAYVKLWFNKTSKELAARGILDKDGKPLNNASLQALWWYFEKSLYKAQGVLPSRYEPVSYLDAAKQTFSEKAPESKKKGKQKKTATENAAAPTDLATPDRESEWYEQDLHDLRMDTMGEAVYQSRALRLLGEDIAANVFCPTGEGGGIDPTCSPQGAKGPAEKGKTGRPARAQKPGAAARAKTMSLAKASMKKTDRASQVRAVVDAYIQDSLAKGAPKGAVEEIKQRAAMESLAHTGERYEVDKANQTKYLRSLKSALDKMPMEAANRVSSWVKDFHWRNNPTDIGDDVEALYRVVADQLFEYGDAIGGATDMVSRVVTLDGAHPSQPDIVGLYLHELSHCLDNSVGQAMMLAGELPRSDESSAYLSKASKWHKAWKEEIEVGTDYHELPDGQVLGTLPDDPRLSRYAITGGPKEGFAEFGRLAYTKPKEAKKKFPKCWAVFKDEGLVE